MTIITEQWQVDIVAQEALLNRALIDQIGAALYPTAPPAARAALVLALSPEMVRLDAICRARAKELGAALIAWRDRPQPVVVDP